MGAKAFCATLTCGAAFPLDSRRAKAEAARKRTNNSSQVTFGSPALGPAWSSCETPSQLGRIFATAAVDQDY